MTEDKGKAAYALPVATNGNVPDEDEYSVKAISKSLEAVALHRDEEVLAQAAPKIRVKQIEKATRLKVGRPIFTDMF